MRTKPLRHFPAGWLLAILYPLFFVVSLICGAQAVAQTTSAWLAFSIALAALIFPLPAYFFWARPVLRMLKTKVRWWFRLYLVAMGGVLLFVGWIAVDAWAPWFMADESVQAVSLLHNERHLLPGARRPYWCENYLTYELPGTTPGTLCADILVDNGVVLKAPGQARLTVRQGWAGRALMHLSPG